MPMSKLFAFKEWLTVSDAARHLSIVFGEDVTETDVLRLAADRRLCMSVRFVNHTCVRRGLVVPCSKEDFVSCIYEAGSNPSLPSSVVGC